MEFVQSLKLQESNVQPLESYDEPRAPLVRQISLDEERLCEGHWKSIHLNDLDTAQGVRLFRAMLLQEFSNSDIVPPKCALITPTPHPRGWWSYWREVRAIEKASRIFRNTESSCWLEEKAKLIPLNSLDKIEFDDILQELCQECSCVEQRAMSVLCFLCAVCLRAAQSEGAWCRAIDWATSHIARVATPWAMRHGGWGVIITKAAGDSIRREDSVILAGALAATFIAILFICRVKLRLNI